MDWRPEKAPVRNSAYAETESSFLPLLGGEKEEERDRGKRERQQDVTIKTERWGRRPAESPQLSLVKDTERWEQALSLLTLVTRAISELVLLPATPNCSGVI